MLIKALRGNFGDHGMVRRGQVIDVPDYRAQQLVKRGLYVGVKGAAGNGDGPLSRHGGQTGTAKQSLSSPAGHRQEVPGSTGSRDDAASSPSTIPGGSRPSRTRSMPATSRGGRPMEASENSGN